MSYLVRVGYDRNERRYYVIESDIPGLNTEASDFEEFVTVTRDVASDLITDHAAGSKILFEREVEFVD